MSKKKVFPFSVGVQQEFTLEDPLFFTDPISPDDIMTLGGPWSIEFTETEPIVDGPPLYTLQVRNDSGADWVAYSPTMVDVDIRIPLEDNHFSFFNMRLKIDPNGTTDGAGKIGLFFKGK